MPYSQKYTLVAFLKPIDEGIEFEMSDWPVHVTLADVFAIDIHNGIEALLATLLSNQPAVSIKAGKESILGSAKVILLESNDAITNLHNRIIDVLVSKDAIFNSPEYTRNGFLPHSTIQPSGRLNEGDIEFIKSISVVDMFPGGDWRQRKVVRTFNLQEGVE